MKNIFKSMLLFSVVLFCFVGCVDDPQSSGNDISLTENPSSSFSDSGIDGSTAELSSSDNDNSNEAVNIDDLDHDSFDFTEDDLWLQSFLKDNWDMAYYLCRTYKDPSYEIQYESAPDPEHKYRYILKKDDYEVPYDLVDNTYFDNAEEYQALCDKYYSSDVFKVSIPDADVADPENDYISIRGERDHDPQLIEINGRLYHIASGMGGIFVPRLDMAKVISRTDSEIVFSYLCVLYVPDDVTAGKGVLKKEDGVWKFGWSDLSMPMENLDIHEVWGI